MIMGINVHIMIYNIITINPHKKNQPIGLLLVPIDYGDSGGDYISTTTQIGPL